MSYTLTRTDGNLLLTLADGAEDSTTTSVNLIGRNYPNFGQFLNENFIKILENFSSQNAPANPLVGQLWWNSDSKHLSIWTGVVWKVISSSQTGSLSPANPIVGDFWWNTTGTGQLNVYDGTQWQSIGPATPPGVAQTSVQQFTVSDGSTNHYVGNVTVNNKFTGVFSSDATSFNPATPLGGLTTIYPGLNLPTGLTTSNLTANNTSILNANVGNLSVSSLSVSGNVSFTGNVTFPSSPSTFGNIASDIVPFQGNSYNLGSNTKWWTNIYGTSIHAQYADLAERFAADAVYEPGTVVDLGGAAEITISSRDLSEDVLGVISTNAAFVMNNKAGSDATYPPVAVQGRVPVRVIGTVRKGDRLVSAGNGVARAGTRAEITVWNVIGRSLENKDTLGEGTIEAVVKLNS